MVVDSHEPLAGGCLPRARPLTIRGINYDITVYC
ncbi:hypothetical protein JOC33_001134 [Thalassobacillus pellis]|nr:hypothetical protein [Thalassobacillus pellis]